MEGNQSVRVVHGGATLEIPAATVVRNWMESLQAQVVPFPLSPGLTPPRIGEYWKGEGGVYAGICRGIDTPDYHVIVPPAGYIEKIQWGAQGEEEPGATSQFDGWANTLSLCESSHSHPAAEWAREYSADGHDDFYLPARREAALMYANLPELLNKKWHWTSTQYSALYAWFTSFEHGYQDTLSKHREFAAQAVRRLFI